MKKQVMIYEIKSEAVSNAKELFSEERDYFYWNDAKFINLNDQDIVFVVNPHENWVLWTEFESGRIQTSLDKETLTASFNDNGVQFKVNAPTESQLSQWQNFIRLKIIKRFDTGDSWDWKSLGSSEITYLNGDRIDGQNYNRVINLNSLEKLSGDEEFRSILSQCRKNFKSADPKANEGRNSNKPEVNEHIQIISKVVDYLKWNGFTYSMKELANFYLSLKTKPFVILAGISGTGKTQLPRMFAEAVGMSEEQVIQVPVRPDWTDGSDLLGYTGLNDKFQAKGLTIAIKKANENKNKPYFFILDEMNLARVEHYFSEFLSVIETRRRGSDGETILTDPILREEMIHNADNRDEFEDMRWPENLYLIGTVNMDETTFSFSKKVLDRANTIEMNEVDLSFKDQKGDDVVPLDNIENSFFKTEFIRSTELSDSDREALENDILLLSEINEILKISDLHFAYRVRDEIAYYTTMNRTYNLISDSEAMDFQIMQKVLPRIHGSSIRVQRILVRMLNKLNNTNLGEESPDLSALGALEKEIKESAYPRTGKKLLFMLQRFEEDRFTSFWV